MGSVLLWLLMIVLALSVRYREKLYFKERLYSLGIMVVLRMLATLGVQYTLLIIGIVQVRGQLFEIVGCWENENVNLVHVMGIGLRWFIGPNRQRKIINILTVMIVVITTIIIIIVIVM